LIIVDVSASTEACLINVHRSVSGRTGCRRCGRVGMTHCLIVVCAEVDKDCTPHCPPNPKNYQAICSFGRCMCYGCGCGWIFNDWGVEMQEVINRRAVIRM